MPLLAARFFRAFSASTYVFQKPLGATSCCQVLITLVSLFLSSKHFVLLLAARVLLGMLNFKIVFEGAWCHCLLVGSSNPRQLGFVLQSAWCYSLLPGSSKHLQPQDMSLKALGATPCCQVVPNLSSKVAPNLSSYILSVKALGATPCCQVLPSRLSFKICA